nr:hypothetical protein DA06_22875 [Georgenia sp. SUBG003]
MEKISSYASKARRALATPALPRSAFASSVPIASRRASISASTRETKKEATERIPLRSMPAAWARSSPSRYAAATAR